MNTIELRQQGRVLTAALNRPEQHNAINGEMVAALTAVFQDLDRREDVRVVVLTGNGRSFCAGADLAMMRAAADYSYDENLADGRAIFDLMVAVDGCRKPIVGRVNGAAFGGGAGLVSCCDIVVAGERARFGFTEARLGIVPAVISPFVLAKIGPTHGRELFLTGERFDAAWARHIGLVHHVVAEQDLDDKVQERVAELLQAAPGAQAEVKALIGTVAYRPKSDLRDFTATVIARRRASDEGREGMSAFLQKRAPWWQGEEP
jgi:methylglutaconyl-CoA hydratase